MSVQKIDAALMKKMFIGAAAGLSSQKEIINELNVFPVPDGDTGTNMTMTIMSAVNEVEALENPTMAELAKAISSGSLRGARGNSGVILSQLLRGFTKVIRDVEQIDIETAANAFQKAVETAYKAVMKPKEGTILTVAKGGADKAMELVGTTDDFVVFCEKVIKYMAEVLDYTPELLPVLKEAGVFDAVSGVLAGKPMDAAYEQEYKQILVEEIGDPDLPIVFNVNVGHAQPRCIIPFGVEAIVDMNEQVIRFAD